MQKASASCLHGIDVSHWQGEIDWHSVKKDNISFAYIKSTEGRTYTDPRFISNARGAITANIPTGAYHFARPDNNPTKQGAIEEAKHFIKTMAEGFGKNRVGGILPVLDLEVQPAKKDSEAATHEILEWTASFDRYFTESTGKALMLYTGSYFIKEHNNFNHPAHGFILAHMPLWIAMYPHARGNPEYPDNAGGWARWTAWQYTNSGRVKGIKGNVDLNWAVPELVRSC